MPRPIDLFFSYAHADTALMHQVRQQLVHFDRQNIIRKWYDRMIKPGEEWEGKIDMNLRQADIILLFLSPDFLESQYCYKVEMPLALQRHAEGTAHAIPIILRHCMWQHTGVAALQALPTDARPLARWEDRDEGTKNVADGVMRVVYELAGAEER